jgi:hypothetical protein
MEKLLSGGSLLQAAWAKCSQDPSQQKKQGRVAYSYHPSYVENDKIGGVQSRMGQVNPISKITWIKSTRGVTQVAEPMPLKYKALRSNPFTESKKKKKIGALEHLWKGFYSLLKVSVLCMRFCLCDVCVHLCVCAKMKNW